MCVWILVDNLEISAKLQHKNSVYLKTRQRFPCFHKVMVIRLEVWDNEKSWGNMSSMQANASAAFLSCPKLSRLLQ